MAELKPCPFCGGEAVLGTKHFEDRRMVAVLCENCGASARAFLTEYYFVEDEAEKRAIDAWNRRCDNG